MKRQSAAAGEHTGRWIQPNPHTPDPAEAWVLPRCVSVWVVIRQLQLDDDKAGVVADAYELPLEAIEAAVAYYRRHTAEIDARIQENRAFFGV